MNEIEVYELYDIWYNPWWQHWSVRAFGITFLVLVVSLIGWLLWRWYRPKKVTPPWQQALDQCAALREQLDIMSARALYAQLTVILKDYLVQREIAQVHAVTDQELTKRIKDAAIDDEHKAQIQQLLLLAVPVKFAHDTPEQQQREAHIAQVEQFIRDTTP